MPIKSKTTLKQHLDTIRKKAHKTMAKNGHFSRMGKLRWVKK